jgi:transcription termination/antitermination protein NusG
MQTNNELDYKSWYVLQVSTGKENFIKKSIEKHSDKEVRLVIFSKEIIHRKNNKYINLISPLFPGYIFIQEKIIDVLNILKQYLRDEFIRPIKFGNEPAKVSTDEMKLLLLNSNYEGKIPLSYGYKNGDSIVIMEGPLKYIQGKILFINEKKKKAKVELNLFERTVTVSLGIDLINKKK